MKLKDWVAVTNGIDEFNIYLGYTYYKEAKDRMLETIGENEIDKILIETFEEGDWVAANIFLK